MKIYPVLFMIFVSLLSLLVGGCNGEKLPDNNYLREDASSLHTYTREGRSFFPQGLGSTWRYGVTGQPLEIETVSKEVKRTIITSKYIEERSSLPTTIQGNRTIYPMTRRILGQNEPLEGEIFQESAEGLFLQKGIFLFKANALETAMELSPPLTLTKYPMREGDTILWSGNLIFDGKKYPAQGASRMTRRETIDTRQGKMDAYRIDTRIFTVDQQTAYILTMRWFVPERGMMRLRTVRPKELLNYEILK